MPSNAIETREESNLGLEKTRVWEIKSNAIFWLIRLGIPQSALAFIFIGREVVPLSKSVYTRISKIKRSILGLQLDIPVWPVGPTGQTGRHLNCQNWLSTHAPLFFGEFHKLKSKNYPDVHVLHRAYKFKNKTKDDIQYRLSSSSRTLPYARIEFLQVSPIDSPR